MNRSTSADHEVPDFEVDRRNISPFVFVAGVAMLAVIAFGVFAVLMQNVDEPKKRSTGLQQLTMPDGTVLVLEDVTFGKRHEFQFERELQSGTLFSGPSLQIDVASTSTPDDAIMLWFSRHDAVTGEALDFEWWSHCIALDEHGCAIEDEKPGRDIYYLDGGHSGMSGAHRPFNPTPSGRRCEKIIVRSSLKPFRHKAKTFKLQVFDAIGTKVAEFDVPNPNPRRGSYPVWKPEPLPITKKQGDLEVTLTGLAAFEEEYRSSEGPRQRIRLQPQLRIVEDGKPVNQWLFYGPEIEDALGNTSDSSDCRSCLKETAWKLKFKLFVTDPAMIEPSEQWTVSDLKLLAANKSQMLNKSKTIDGVTVELLAIGGPGRSSYTGLIAQHQKHAQNDTSTITYGKFKAPLSIHFNPGSGLNTTSIDCPLPHVIARLGRSNQDQRVTMQITDDQQRPVKSRTRNIRGVRIWFLFDLAKETKSFNVHFVVQRARKFEFLVKPPEPQKIKPPVRPRPAESPAQRLTRMRGEIQSLQKTLAGNPNNAGTCNRLAWTYVTAPKELQDSKQAVTLAQRAVAGADTWNNRNTWGVAYYRNAEYKRAVEILEGNQPRRDPNLGSFDLYFLAMSYFELQQPDKAKKTFQQAYQLHQAKDAVLSDRHAVELARFRDEAVALLLGGTPKNLIEQAEQLARKGDWKGAADEFVRVLEIFPDDHWAWSRSAVLQLKLGNFSGYQQHCRKMLELFGQTGDAYIAERAGKICLIVPDALPGDKRPFQLAERAVSLNNRNPLFTLSLGIARYRDGQFRSCLKWLKDSETGTGYNTKNIYFAATLNLFRAMAHHRLKQTDQAQQSLAYSTKIIEERFPKLGAGWHDRLMCEIVFEEARKLIGEKLNAEQQPETPPVAAPKPGG